ncbi:RimK family alpha-L-glutamate ligase [Bradyrhizobium sp. 151]|uniref:RimK family alpha-L-glutamate ligase n=1 Tax=Bradyrhizobium sp. 151 TaxID=2782626 RepID=UPI001FFA048E|nr:RimK family alpha-L-glutamate ligase [Bradyrhizobium sp. 151]MCK1656611.1 RimK family alpha-L-glutamate ligase [Bradyrhizobium sp. 151]
MRLLILTRHLNCLGENDAPISNAFRRLGCEVILGDVNTIAADDYRYFARGVRVPEDGEPYYPGSAAPGHRDAYFLDECQLVWVMTPPHPLVARDVWQMLWLASKKVRFVNSIEGLAFLDTKHALGYVVPKENRPTSYISNDFSLMWERYQQIKDQCWVAKPPNAFGGQNVFLLSPNGSNVRTILQCLTGNTVALDEFGAVAQHGKRELGHGVRGFKAEYAILQQHIAEVAHGEKRIIVACGKAVAWHGRQSPPDDHRSNITQGGRLVPVDLHPGEVELAELVGQKLMAHGISFVGIDMAYPYVLEFNIANTGGLYDTQLASGIDHSDEVAELLIAYVNR